MNIIGSKIFDNTAKRNLEFFNEIILTLVMYTIFTFSPWVPDAELRYQIGYVTIAIISLHLFVNLGMIFRQTQRMFTKNTKVHYALKKNKAKRKLLKVVIENTHAKRM